MKEKLFFRRLLAVLACFTISVAHAWCQNPAGKTKDGPATPEEVQKAIQKGVDFLLSIQKPEGNWEPAPLEWDKTGIGFLTGPTGAAIYALLECGVDVKDPKIVKALDWLVKNQDKESKTYSVGLRCNAWLIANKLTKNAYRKNLEKDVNMCVVTGIDQCGGASYACHSESKKLAAFNNADNSNTQYLLLGAWAGYRSNIEIPKEFWTISLKYWITCQKTDGGWVYSNEGESTGTMSAAGLASLFVCIDASMGDKFIKCNVSSEYAPVKKALDWFDENFEKTISRYTSPYYYYSIERIGLASGYKYFGKIDWYKEVAKKIVGEMAADGGWRASTEPTNGQRVAFTSEALVFLARGQRPVLFNRLEYDGDWNNRPRALANFCRWAENAYEHEVNWQIITLKSDVREWHDAPVVLITGSRPPKFSDEDMAKLRTYVEQGGTLLSISECNGGGAFGVGMKNVYKKLFPKYEMANLGRDHPLYQAHYKLAGVPPFSMVTNGVRPLAIHTDADLPVSWQTYAVATAKGNFDAGANLLTYVTDRELYNRGARVWPEAAAADKKLKASRIKYSGNYDPEPLALERLSRLMAQSYKTQLDYTSALSASAPASQGSTPPASAIPVTGISATQLTTDIKLAFLTGTGAFKLTGEEKDALKKWIEAGGLLIMDAAGGNKTFTESAKDLLGELYGPDALLPLPLSSPVYQIKDMTIDKVKYRKTTKTRIGGITEPRLMSVQAGDKPKVILSAEDLTAGLVGYDSWGVDGYAPASAFNLARNIILYTATGNPAK